ncbi:c-type cytochrome [Phreatobacter sp.]|uniref:c-type cytochrome n=1 Tax=Phreatobacter sp. TaxID=1966341 RepID=UPI003F727BBE
MIARFSTAAAAVALIATVGLLPGLGGSAGASQESAQVAQGRAHYVEHCQLCHGADGQRGEGYQTPIWGSGTQIAKFGNAQGLLDYMQLMPFNDPSLLDETQKLAVVAFMLAQHGAIKPTDQIDRAAAANVPIP